MFTVRLDGRPVKNFANLQDAQQYMVYLSQWQSSQNLIFQYVEGALLNSDMKESKEIINHIMEKK
jgi:hypothetical protein